MNMKCFAAILFFALPGVTARAAEQVSPAPAVAVYDFKGDGAAANFSGEVTALVTADLAADTNLALVERAELTKALAEQSFGVSGLVGSDAAAKIGQLTGAKVLVAGQVIKTGDKHLIVVANIVGTETGRLFADKVEGPSDNVVALAADLSHKIAQTITEQQTNLMLPTAESHAERIARILNTITGTHRPLVSLKITQYNQWSRWRDGGPETELGGLLLKAGFKVVDDASDQKPDLLITGDVTTTGTEGGIRRGGLLSVRATIELKIQDRRTGNILALERQETTAAGIGETIVDRQAQFNMMDDLAERILPVLAK